MRESERVSRVRVYLISYETLSSVLRFSDCDTSLYFTSTLRHRHVAPAWRRRGAAWLKSLNPQPHASRDGTTDRVRSSQNFAGAGLKKENTLARSRLYSDFARGVAEKGVTAFAGTKKKTTQGLSLTNLFSFDQRTGKASAILEPLSVPVRAIVVPLPGDSSAARKIRRETRDALRQFFPPAGGDFGHGDSVWFQDSELFHFSVFHASHHGAPVPASELEKND